LVFRRTCSDFEKHWADRRSSQRAKIHFHYRRQKIDPLFLFIKVLLRKVILLGVDRRKVNQTAMQARLELSLMIQKAFEWQANQTGYHLQSQINHSQALLHYCRTAVFVLSLLIRKSQPNVELKD
jgi:hypothetical protein